ncbi:MAG: ATP-dependent metallopeptidase FtsH/Yme1/Tma family protein [Desulfobulbaceae bacterium]|nr:ATP-dependent metallopeptidase FtsH/Yme1/Tma family protein [Desulfobulbaceae bacterium]
MTQFYKKMAVWLGVCVVAVLVFTLYGRPGESESTLVSYSQFRENLENDVITHLTIEENKAIWVSKEESFSAQLPDSMAHIDTYVDAGIEVEIIGEKKGECCISSIHGLLSSFYVAFGIFLFVKVAWVKRRPLVNFRRRLLMRIAPM